MAPKYFKICANSTSHSAISRIGTEVNPSITLPPPFDSVRTLKRHRQAGGKDEETRGERADDDSERKQGR
jgi:hypothetical protein